MDYLDLIKIFSNTKKSPDPRPLANGVAIISKYQKVEECASSQDKLYYGNSFEIAKNISTEDAEQLALLGWRIEFDSFFIQI